MKYLTTAVSVFAACFISFSPLDKAYSRNILDIAKKGVEISSSKNNNERLTIKERIEKKFSDRVGRKLKYSYSDSLEDIMREESALSRDFVFYREGWEDVQEARQDYVQRKSLEVLEDTFFMTPLGKVVKFYSDRLKALKTFGFASLEDDVRFYKPMELTENRKKNDSFDHLVYFDVGFSGGVGLLDDVSFSVNYSNGKGFDSKINLELDSSLDKSYAFELKKKDLLFDSFDIKVYVSNKGVIEENKGYEVGFFAEYDW